MRIQKILDQSQLDFTAIYECEHCGHTNRGNGYDDANFHETVIPKMACKGCGKTAGDDYLPLATKYPEGEQV